MRSVTFGPLGDVAWVVYETTETFGPRSFVGTAILQKTTSSDWTMIHDHRSIMML